MDINICLPIAIIDFLGAIVLIFISFLCLIVATKISQAQQDNVLYGYLAWLIAAIFAFSLSRSLGHILKHILLYFNKDNLWQVLSPISGSVNSALFILIASITIFFQKIYKITLRLERDKEEIKKISKELIKLNQNTEVLVSERTRAELALNVAHEVRNPVMIIGGLINRALKNKSDQKRQKDLLAALEQVKRLEKIVKKFETLTRDLSWAISKKDINEIVKNAINIIKPEATEKNIDLETKMEKGPIFVEVNPSLIQLSIHHCLRNAIEASKPGNKIEVITMRDKFGAKIKIIDYGVGIAEKDLKKIFTPFFSTKKTSSGLGLSMVKQIIKEHGGTINIFSTLGKGTTVEIFLPTKIGIGKNW